MQITLIPAALQDYDTIQNMGKFYGYDMSRDCGWPWKSEDGGYPSQGFINNFKTFFEDQNGKAYLIKIDNELAGFILLNQKIEFPNTDWNMDEFFILAKFQSKGLGKKIAHQVFDSHPGNWEIPVLPENKSALIFWEKTIRSYTTNHFNRQIMDVDFGKGKVKLVIFSFNTNNSSFLDTKNISVRLSEKKDIPSMVVLSHQKRRLYEKVQPKFWRHAGPQAEQAQEKWFEELLVDDDCIMLTAENNGKIVGFIIGRLTSAPEVYNPGGLTLMIDDFCIENEIDWQFLGKKLIDEIKKQVKERGAVQVIVVCGNHDHPKSHFLIEMGLTVVSNWHYGEIT